MAGKRLSTGCGPCRRCMLALKVEEDGLETKDALLHMAVETVPFPWTVR